MLQQQNIMLLGPRGPGKAFLGPGFGGFPWGREKSCGTVCPLSVRICSAGGPHRAPTAGRLCRVAGSSHTLG
jgi:hypothetical protein